VPSSPIDVLARHLEHVAVANPPAALLDLPTLAEILDALPDPGSRRGRRYLPGPPPALSLLAVLSGATSPAKIARFVAGYDPDLRARAGLPGTPDHGRPPQPGFVAFPDLMVIDEIQRVPDLLLAIKSQVDRDPRPGRYLLSVSCSIPATRPTRSATGCGRCR